MNGNVTREGITADLEWMKRVGIGGVQQFDADIGNILEGQRDRPRSTWRSASSTTAPSGRTCCATPPPSPTGSAWR